MYFIIPGVSKISEQSEKWPLIKTYEVFGQNSILIR